MKYLGQRDNYNCAPIMIINLCKWAGFNATYKDIEHVSIALNTKQNGTTDEETNKYINKIKNIKVSKPRYLKDANFLKRALQKDKAVIITYHFTEEERKIYNGDGHIFICTKYDKGFVAINYKGGETTSKIYFPTIEELLNRKGTKVWIIKRKK